STGLLIAWLSRRRPYGRAWTNWRGPGGAAGSRPRPAPPAEATEHDAPAAPVAPPALPPLLAAPDLVAAAKAAGPPGEPWPPRLPWSGAGSLPTEIVGRGAERRRPLLPDASTVARGGSRGEEGLMEKIDDALKTLLESGKDKGYLTYDQVNDHLPDDDANPEKIDQILILLEEQGIELIEESEAEEREGGAAPAIDEDARAEL